MITVVYTVHAGLLFKGGGVEYAPGTAATCFSASLFRRTLWTIYPTLQVTFLNKLL